MKKKMIIVLASTIILLSIILIYSKNVTTHSLKVVEYGIKKENLPNDFHGMKIVHFSDISYGKSTTLKDLEKVVNKINEIKPDIVVFSGDLFSKDIKMSDKEKEKVKTLITSINAKYEKYAILGDTDFKYKDDFYQLFDTFTILDNESTLLYISNDKPIRITGISDYKSEDIITDTENPLFNILIIHKPDEIEKLKNKYDLAFAGHSMGGQIKIPFFGPLIKKSGAKKYTSGMYKVNDTDLFVSDGIGTQGTNMRVNNKPKINLYRVYNH